MRLHEKVHYKVDGEMAISVAIPFFAENIVTVGKNLFELGYLMAEVFKQ